ncbi:MAG: DNA-deoxyinosine glycosylase [Parvibaculales bacterium]
MSRHRSPERANHFPPVLPPAARTLILGSLPGVASLKAQQYYAHPRNAFWPIIAALAGLDTPPAPYAARLALLDQLGLALWDVAASAERQASADATMRRVETGDFQTLYRRHPAICRVCFNGRTAETLYRRHVLPGLPEDIRTRLVHHPALPSTSPAHAAMSLAEKKRKWLGVLKPESR